MSQKIRRYDLDWLRVLVFGLLIFYHVGMYFVPWGWHIKNPEEYDWLRWPMVFVNQWRLPILFLISGMGTRFALSWRSGRQYASERFKRLWIPLAFGMFFIVPPQVYIERLVNQDFTGTYWQFYSTVAFQGIYPEGNFSWHHLWFLPYLLVFSLILTPAFLYLRNHPEASFLTWIRKRLSTKMGIYWLVIPLFLTESLLEPFFPVTHALVNDWFAFTNFLILFFYGFLLISLGDQLWSILAKVKHNALLIGITAFLTQAGIWIFLEDGLLVHFVEAFVKVLNLWSWIIVLLAYAAQYLNRPSALLSYCNEAVYPFYILHQTITIIIGYYLLNYDWPFLPKFLAMSVGTFLGSWILYEGIRRVNILRPLFGLKGRFKRKNQTLQVALK